MADAKCVFCGLIAGPDFAGKIFEDKISAAFLDHRPLFPGHCLLIPKLHVETLSGLPARLTGPFFRRAQQLAAAVEKAMDAQGTFVAMNNRVSQSVPHLHVHIVPRRRGDGLRGFFWPRTKYASEEELRKVRDRIAAELES